tara:strand:+ start:27 stop:380 length:354 start_codon:yes stop_codon:yes gene_type:complete
METKEELMNGVKNWVAIDNEIIKYKSQIRELNKQKKTLTHSLVDVMKRNEIECFDLNDGAIFYKKSVVKKPITAKHLLGVLSNYYDKKEEAEDLTKYILDNREVKVKENINRKIDNK